MYESGVHKPFGHIAYEKDISLDLKLVIKGSERVCGSSFRKHRAFCTSNALNLYTPKAYYSVNGGERL